MNISVKNLSSGGVSSAFGTAADLMPQNKTSSGGAEQHASHLMHSESMNLLSIPQGITDGRSQGLGKLGKAAGTINDYMESTGMNTMNTNQLKQLATGTSPTGMGQVPDKVAEAAAFMLAGPKKADGESKRWSKVDTADGASDDGLAARGNFAKLAQGGGQAAPTQSPQQGQSILQDGGIPKDFMALLSQLADQTSQIQELEQMLMDAISSMQSGSAGTSQGSGLLNQSSGLGGSAQAIGGSAMGHGQAIAGDQGPGMQSIAQLGGAGASEGSGLLSQAPGLGGSAQAIGGSVMGHGQALAGDHPPGMQPIAQSRGAGASEGSGLLSQAPGLSGSAQAIGGSAIGHGQALAGDHAPAVQSIVPSGGAGASQGSGLPSQSSTGGGSAHANGHRMHNDGPLQVPTAQAV